MGATIKRVDRIFEDMVLWITSHTDKITDFSPGSVIRAFCEATSVQIEEIYVSAYLAIRDELRFIKERSFEFPRKEGTRAVASVVFARETANGEVLIVEGTRVSTPGGSVFVTQHGATIAVGETESDSVAVQAEEVGSEHRVDAGLISVLVDAPDGVDTVSNPLPATGGTDRETDAQYHSRFQQYVEGLGRSNRAGLLFGALTVPGVVSASLIELSPPEDGVHVRLYADSGELTGTSEEILWQVQNVIDGDDTAANPGYRAAGVNIQVLSPSVVAVDISAQVSVPSDAGVNEARVVEEATAAIASYVNSRGVGDSVIRSRLISGLMSVFGVSDVSLLAPMTNVSATDSQVLRVGVVTISIVSEAAS